MPKPTKADLKKYRAILQKNLSILKGDVGSMRDEALRASEQDASVDHLADQGTDNYDQGFLLGLIENEEVTIQMIEEALDRIDGAGDFPFGACVRCHEIAEEEAEEKGKKAKKAEPWIPKERLEYIPWARYCVAHQEELERSRESA
ncbi:MAG: TraR/DksA C4-type zinc finger protein [Planctomycetota bacterium]